MFVGRDRELRELDAAIAAATTRGTYIALVGEPGIGKSRLAEEATNRAEQAGFRIAWGRCWEAGGGPPYWPWTEALRALDLETRWNLPDQFEVFDAVARSLKVAAQERPVAIVLDDVHAADRSSLLLLQFVARQLRFSRVLVIATYRDVEARMQGDVAEVLAKVAREGKTLALAPLTRDEVARLAEATFVDTVFEASEGNPLFVHELLQLFAARGGAGGIPDGIRALIAERLRLVSAGVRDVLAMASTIGREVEGTIVAELVSLAGSSDPSIPIASGVGSVTAAGTGVALADAVRAGIVVQVGERFRFAHVHIRDVLYESLSPGRRAELHGAVAEVFARRGADPSAIAHHRFAAVTSARGTVERAIAAARAAADDANRRLAFDEAAALLERASALEPSDLELALALGTALIRAGRTDDGQRLCARVARETEEPSLVARAALAYGLVYKFGRSDGSLVALLEDALAALPDGDSTLRAQLLGRLAGALQPADDLAVPMAAARRAIEMARRIGDAETLGSVLVSAGSALQDVADAEERLKNNEELVRLANAKHDPLLAARGQLRLAFDHLELGNVATADACAREHQDLIGEHRNPRLHWPSAMYRALRADMAGRFAEADDHVADARRLFERAGDAGARVTLGIHAVCSAITRDSTAELHAAERVLAENAYHPGVQQILAALLACRLGRLDEARARAAAPLSHSWYLQASAGTCFAEVVAIAGTPEQQRIVYDELVSYGERGRVGVWSMTAFASLGPVARPLSLLAAALGRWDAAERFARRALADALAQQHLPIVARTRYEWGSALLRRGDAEGRKLVEEALATATELGMTNLVDKCRALTSTPATVAVAAPVEAPVAAVLTVERDGDSWILRSGSEHVRVRDSRGLQIISELVAREGDDVHVLDLSGGGAVDGGDAGEVLDKSALATYRRRIGELTEELAEAEDRNDLGRAERLREELEALEDEIRGAVGIGGRQRRTGSAVERARINVQRRIKAAIGQVERLAPSLAHHLTRSIRTGSFCSYVPRVTTRAN